MLCFFCPVVLIPGPSFDVAGCCHLIELDYGLVRNDVASVEGAGWFEEHALDLPVWDHRTVLDQPRYDDELARSYENVPITELH